MISVSRDQIDQLIAAGKVLDARAALMRLWRESSTPATAAFVVSRFEQVQARLDLMPCRVAILRSFTVEPILPLLRALAFVGGIDLQVRVGGFNTYAQDIFDAGEWFYSFSPEVVILAVQTRDIAPALWENPASMELDQVNAVIAQAVETFRQLVQTFRSHSPAHLIIHTLECPPTPTGVGRDFRSDSGRMAAIAQINSAISDLAREFRNVYLLDYNALIARHGTSAWHDEGKWQLARLPIAAGKLIYLAQEWMRFLHPIAGRICKVLAVDLDNTLWGGVVGEDGFAGIKLSDDAAGAPYRDLQRALLELHKRGVILAICSKNNPAEAMEVLEKHPEMILRPGHFAAVRINWDDKAANLRAIARELNVGIDSIALLDDNPVEREWIREQIPEVTVIEFPAEPSRYAEIVRDAPVFERLEFTEEDQARGKFYADQRQRAALEQSATSLEDFYRSLQMRVRVELVNERTLARAAQLTQKTNQFNLTTGRYSEQQMAEMIASPAWRAFTIEVTDRFGNNGIVGVAILRFADDRCEIDTFLLSCRVIGRTIETAFLAAIAADAARDGAKTLVGWFIPTKKNAPSAGFYQQHGFTQTQTRNDATFWELDLAQKSISCPPWIIVE